MAATPCSTSLATHTAHSGPHLLFIIVAECVVMWPAKHVLNCLYMTYLNRSVVSKISQQFSAQVNIDKTCHSSTQLYTKEYAFSAVRIIE